MLRETELIRSPAANARPENPTISRRTRSRRFGHRPAPSSSSAASSGVGGQRLHDERPVAPTEHGDDDT